MKAKMKSRKKGLCVSDFHILFGSTEDAKTPNFSGIIRSKDFAFSQLFAFSRNMPKGPFRSAPVLTQRSTAVRISLTFIINSMLSHFQRVWSEYAVLYTSFEFSVHSVEQVSLMTRNLRPRIMHALGLVNDFGK